MEKLCPEGALVVRFTGDPFMPWGNFLCEDSACLIGLHMFIVAEVLHIAGPAEVDDGLRFLGFAKYTLEN